jgi:hypothetical protein
MQFLKYLNLVDLSFLCIYDIVFQTKKSLPFQIECFELGEKCPLEHNYNQNQ